MLRKLRNILSDRCCPCCDQFKTRVVAVTASGQEIWQCPTTGLCMVIDPADPYSFSLRRADFDLGPGEHAAVKRLAAG